MAKKQLNINFNQPFLQTVDNKVILGDSRNYMLPILVQSSAKRIATQIVVIAKLNGRKYFILRGFFL